MTFEKKTCSDLARRRFASLIAKIVRPPVGGVGGVGKKRPDRHRYNLAVWAVWAVWSPIDSSHKYNTLRVSLRNGTYYLTERGKGEKYAYIRRNGSLPEPREIQPRTWLFGTLFLSNTNDVTGLIAAGYRNQNP